MFVPANDSSLTPKAGGMAKISTFLQGHLLRLHGLLRLIFVYDVTYVRGVHFLKYMYVDPN